METINLLDLDNDILKIIGGYVKKDNVERTEKVHRNFVQFYKDLYDIDGAYMMLKR